MRVLLIKIIKYCVKLAECSVIVTSNQGIRGGKLIELKKTVDVAVEQCPSIRHVFVMQRTENEMSLGPKDINMNEVD